MYKAEILQICGDFEPMAASMFSALFPSLGVRGKRHKRHEMSVTYLERVRQGQERD